MAVRVDPRLDALPGGLRNIRQQHRAAGMIAREFGDELRVRFQRIHAFAIDREIHQRRAGTRAAMFSQSFVSSRRDLTELNRLTRGW